MPFAVRLDKHIFSYILRKSFNYSPVHNEFADGDGRSSQQHAYPSNARACARAHIIYRNIQTLAQTTSGCRQAELLMPPRYRPALQKRESPLWRSNARAVPHTVDRSRYKYERGVRRSRVY